MSLEFTVFSDSPLAPEELLLPFSDAYEDVETLKPLLLYADKITLHSNTFAKVFASFTNGDELADAGLKAYEQQPEAAQRFLDTVCIIEKLRLSGILEPFLRPNDETLIGMINDEDTRSFFSTLDKISFSERYFISLMKVLAHEGISVYSPTAYKLLKKPIPQEIPASASPSASQASLHLINHLAMQLPNFQETPVDEILDIRKELDGPLVRFRGAVLRYADDIKQIEDERDIANICNELYIKEIAPSLQDIKEAAASGGFVKNLGYNLFSDKDLALKAGSLIVGVAGASVPGALAAWAASSVISTAKDLQNKEKAAKGHELYFYYETHRRLARPRV